MIDPDRPLVGLGLVTEAAQGTPLASYGAITGALGDITALRPGLYRTAPGHALPHRAYVIISFLIIIEAVGMKGVRFIAGTVFQMETIVFDEPLNAGFVHETVVLFRAVSGVGDDPFWETTVTARERAKEWYEGQRVGWVRKEGEVCDELVLGGYLQVVAGHDKI